jgi:hypothetical protein
MAHHIGLIKPLPVPVERTCLHPQRIARKPDYAFDDLQAGLLDGLMDDYRAIASRSHGRGPLCRIEEVSR